MASTGRLHVNKQRKKTKLRDFGGVGRGGEKRNQKRKRGKGREKALGKGKRGKGRQKMRR